MPSRFPDVEAYLASLPEDRASLLRRVRALLLAHLPEGYEEGIQYGMIGYFVPKSRYPKGYHAKPSEPLPFAALAAQKNHAALYLMYCSADSDETQRLHEGFARAGKRLDMGASCLRFRSYDDLAPDVLAESLRRHPVDAFVARYEASLAPRARKRPTRTPGGTSPEPVRKPSRGARR